MLAREAQMKHEYAFQPMTDSETELAVGGAYHFRTDGEYHLLNPLTISKLQHAVRHNSFKTFQEYTELIDEQSRSLCTLRSLMKIKKSREATFRSRRSSPPRKSLSGLPPARCRSARSAKKPTKPSPLP